MPLPDSELLERNLSNPTWVRVAFVVRTPLGIGAAKTAQQLGKRIRESAAVSTSGISISVPEVSGGALVMDFRIKRTVSVREFRRELEALAGGFIRRGQLEGGALTRLEVRNIERIRRDEFRETAPAERQRAAAEAEEARAESTVSIPGIWRSFVGGLKMARGVMVLVIIAALVWVGWPFLKSAAVATRARGRARGS